MEGTVLNKFNYLLASRSPRRQSLLREIGINYTLIDLHHHESLPNNMPLEHTAGFLAIQKSHAYDELVQGDMLITADTIVVLGREILHKPVNEEDAKAMIKRLAGNTHRVDTGVCLRTTDKVVTFTESTSVKFRALDNTEIGYYVEHFKPLDKAGAYGIQEWIGYIGVERIEGCFYNVMGLPLSRLYAELKAF